MTKKFNNVDSDIDVWELERLSENFDEKMDIKILNSLLLEKIKKIVTIRTRKVEDLYNDAKREYDDWVLQGKSALKKASKEFLKPGEDIKKLEEYIGGIPIDFIGGGSFESSPVYKKWSVRIKEAKKRLENAKKILATKARHRFDFPNITVDEEESVLTDDSEPVGSTRETISDDVKMFVWKRDSGMCVKCKSREKLEFDHIIPISKGGSNTARNIQLLCEKCNRSKGNSIV